MRGGVRETPMRDWLAGLSLAGIVWRAFGYVALVVPRTER